MPKNKDHILTFRLDDATHKEFIKRCEKMEIPRSLAIRIAVDAWLRKKPKKIVT